MSRAGYSDDCDGWALIRWRGAVKSAIRGERGQQFLRELAEAMDAMPEKRLIAHALQEAGCHCTLGVIGAARGIDMSTIDPENAEQVSAEFGIAPALAKEIVFENDEVGEFAFPYDEHETPEARWQRMRAWVNANLSQANVA